MSQVIWKCKNETTKRSFAYQGARRRNELNQFLRVQASYNSFKTKLNSFYSADISDEFPTSVEERKSVKQIFIFIIIKNPDSILLMILFNWLWCPNKINCFHVVIFEKDTRKLVTSHLCKTNNSVFSSFQVGMFSYVYSSILLTKSSGKYFN